MFSTAMRKLELLTLTVSVAIAIWTFSAAAQQQAAPGAAAAPGICGGQPLCVETSDFVATVTSFRTSQQGVYKVVAVAVRFQNKTTQPLVLGYVANPGIATDDRGNRYIVYGRNAYRGIGLVSGNNFDPRLTLRPGTSADAQFELMFRPTGREVLGSTFTLDLTVDKIGVENNQYTLAGEFPLQFQGLVNGASAAIPGLAAPCAAGQGTATAASRAANTVAALGSIFGRKKTAQDVAKVASAAADCDPTAAAAATVGAMGQATRDPNAQQAAAAAAATMQAAAGVARTAPPASAAPSTPPSAAAPQTAGMQSPPKSAQMALTKGTQARQTQPQAPQAAQPEARAIAGAQPAGAGNASPAATSSVDWDAPSGAPAGSFGKITNYKAMPDVIGIHLGAPLQEAYAILRREFPTTRIDRWQASLPNIGTLGTAKEPLPQNLLVNTNGTWGGGPNSPDQVMVDLTVPPNPQVAWKVSRATWQSLNRGVLLAALREKYGKEVLALDQGSQPTTQDSRIGKMFWLFDENGHPAPLPSSGHETVTRCEVNLSPVEVQNLESDVSPINQMSPWCASAGVIVQVTLYGDANILNGTLTTIADVPLGLRSLKATHAWWRATLEKRKQEEIERSKQKKPIL